MFSEYLFSAILVGRNLTFFEALDACARQNASLPNGDTEDSLQILIDKLKEYNLTSVWLGLYRQDLKTYRWNEQSELGI